MTSLNPTLKRALASCGVPAFFHAWKKTAQHPVLPATYITYHEMLFQHELMADDAPLINGRYARVSVWSDGDTAPIAALVCAGMTGEGFLLRDAQDLFEEDTGTYHWASNWVLYEEANLWLM